MSYYKYRDDVHRIRANTRVTDDGCWQWTGLLNAAGYGRLTAPAVALVAYWRMPRRTR